MGDTVAEIQSGLQTVQQVLPTLEAVAGVIPGVAPYAAVVAPVLNNAVAQALAFMTSQNGGDGIKAFLALLSHIMPGGQNAAELGTAAK